ncbi:hypothetical protein QQG55_0625 [Brugia pahangi]
MGTSFALPPGIQDESFADCHACDGVFPDSSNVPVVLTGIMILWSYAKELQCFALVLIVGCFIETVNFLVCLVRNAEGNCYA